jgi:hypothetical protein
MVSIGAYIDLVVLEEIINQPNAVTEKPVEQGSDISDHIDHQPIIVDITSIIAGEEAEEKYKILEDLRLRMEVFEYYSEQRIEPYKNMAIEAVSMTRTPLVADGHELKINLKQVRIASQTTTKTKLGKDPKTKKKAKKSKKDSKQPKTKTPTTTAKDEKLSSYLYQIIHGGKK